MKRDGTKGFKLYAEPDADDEDAALEAELSAEELEHIGTLPRFFARMRELFHHLTQHWLRLVIDNGASNRSRWPIDPTWQALREAFPVVQVGQHIEPLDEDGRRFVRGSRYSGKARILRRLELGVLSSLELEDASPVSSALAELQRWGERVAAREADRAHARRARYLEVHGSVPRWVEHGMALRLERAEQVRHRVQMLLGTFGAHAVLPLEFKPALSVGNLLVQHLDDLDGEADDKGGLEAVLAQHFAKVYRASMPRGVGARLAAA